MSNNATAIATAYNVRNRFVPLLALFSLLHNTPSFPPFGLLPNRKMTIIFGGHLGTVLWRQDKLNHKDFCRLLKNHH